VTYTAQIKFAPIFNGKLDERPGRFLYQRGGLTLRGDTPILVDHDESRRGDRAEVYEFADLDGPWLVADAEITAPPEWLSTRTKASFEFAPLQQQQANGWNRILRALVTEVSILSPGTNPAEPLARVMLLRQRSPAAVGATSDAAAVGEVFYGGQMIRRPNIGRVLGVR
jgi:hypothetical protein